MRELNYPNYISACKFCTEKKFKLNSGFIRMQNSDINAIFSIQCESCGYSTKTYQYPDITLHAWNMADKLAVMDLVDEFTHTPNRADD